MIAQKAIKLYFKTLEYIALMGLLEFLHYNT